MVFGELWDTAVALGRLGCVVVMSAAASYPSVVKQPQATVTT